MQLLIDILGNDAAEMIAEKINVRCDDLHDMSGSVEEAPYHEARKIHAHVGQVDDDGDFIISVYPAAIPNGTRPIAFISCSTRINL